jgi:O-antigen ligase
MDAILIFVGVAALVWGTIFALRGTLLAGCLIYLLLVNCFGVQFLRFDVGPTTISLDRLFVMLLAAMYAVHWRLGRTEPKPLTKVDLLFFGFLGLLTLSTIAQKLLGNGLEGRPGDKHAVPIVMHLVNGYLTPALLYWIARQSPLRERGVVAVTAALFSFGVYLAATGVLEFSGQWALVFPRYIADPEVGLHFGRARGPMVQSVSYGLYLGVCWLAGLVWRQRLGRVGQLAVFVLSPLFLAGVFFSHTRSVWMGAGLGGMVVLALTLRGRWRPLVLGGAAAAALLLAVTNLDRIVALERGDNSAANTADSATLRKSFAYVSWRMFLDRPLWGVGFGQFTRAKQPYLADRTTELRLEPIRDWSHHNTYLSLLTETGAVGLGLFLAVLVGWSWRAWRLCRDRASPPWAAMQGVLFLGAMAVYAVQLLFHELSFSPLDNSLMFCLAGITVGLTAAPAATPRRATDARRHPELAGAA